MIEITLIVIFTASVLVCLFLTGSVLPALIFGFALFLTYGVVKGSSVLRMFKCAIGGVRSSAGVLLILLLVGMLTATWRASATMAYMVDVVVRVCPVPLIILGTFLLCSLVSFLVGSAFATAATVGAICVVVANSAGVSSLYVGGAVIAGAYFGDRCSAVSGSALLVASLTYTKVKENMRTMVKTSLVPFVATCIFFFAFGLAFAHTSGFAQTPEYLSTCYTLSVIDILPAVAVLVLALVGLPCFAVLAIGALLGGIIAVCVQGCGVPEILYACVFGYVAPGGCAAALSGGGCASMLSAMAIIFISSCYAGMFEESGMLTNIEHVIEKVGEGSGPFFATLLASVFSSICACNQTLAIILTHQLCKKSVPDGELLASHMENTVVLLAACVPWSTAVAVPLAAIETPASCIFFAVYLYLVPLWNAGVAVAEKRNSKKLTSAPAKKATTRA
jgi:Na+:H+ antiporter, NhaC family